MWNYPVPSRLWWSINGSRRSLRFCLRADVCNHNDDLQGCVDPCGYASVDLLVVPVIVIEILVAAQRDLHGRRECQLPV